MISQSIKKMHLFLKTNKWELIFANEDMLTDKSYSEKIKENISLDKDLEKSEQF